MAIVFESPQVQTDNTSWSSVVTAANTNRDGTGTLNSVWTAGAQGGLLYGLRFVPNGENVATLARIFLYNGSAYKLWREFELPATNDSATAAQAEQYLSINRQMAVSRQVLFVLATAVAAGWSVIGEGGDF